MPRICLVPSIGKARSRSTNSCAPKTTSGATGDSCQPMARCLRHGIEPKQPLIELKALFEGGLANLGSAEKRGDRTKGTPLHPVTWTPDLDPNGIRREAHESKIRSSLLKLKLYLHPSSFHAFVNFAYLLDVLLNESNMKVGRIDKRRRVCKLLSPSWSPSSSARRAICQSLKFTAPFGG